VDVFSLGFGPRVLGFQWGETDVRLSLLPLGGYVRLAGYNPEEPDAEDPHGFLAQPTWKRLAFYGGGITANVVITVVVFFGLGVDQARITAVRPLPSPLLVLEAAKGTAAAEAGIQPGDQIRAFGALNFPGNRSEEVRDYIAARPGQTISVTIERDGRTQVLQAVPRNENGKGRLGIAYDTIAVAIDRRPIQFKDLGVGAQQSVVGSYRLGKTILGNFGKLVTGKVNAKEVSGPIGIIREGSRAAKAGLAQYLFLVALISMNLAVLNALPIPFLDGGHAALLCFEKLRGKDLSIAVKERILTGGFLFLAGLMALVIGLDLWKLRH